MNRSDEVGLSCGSEDLGCGEGREDDAPEYHGAGRSRVINRGAISTKSHGMQH